jgi:rod shape-determining protein MreD
MDALLARLVPVATVLVLALGGVMPLGLGESVAFAQCVLPFAAIHHWSRGEEPALPVWLVFVAGIGVDILTYGPVGYWALLYLVGTWLGALPESVTARDSLPGRWLAFGGALCGLTATGWLVASAYFGRLAEPWPMLGAAGVLMLAFPVFSCAFAALDRIGVPARPLNLERRG